MRLQLPAAAVAPDDRPEIASSADEQIGPLQRRQRKRKAGAKKLPKPLSRPPELPGIKAEVPIVDRSVVEVRQGAVRGKGGRGATAVEYGRVRGRPKR